MAGLSVFFMALGAILMFGVNADVQYVDLDVVGFVLIVVGIIGLLVHLVRRPGSVHTHSERVVSPDGRHVVEEHEQHTGV